MESPQLEQLVQASRTGDKQSFGRIVSAYQGRVCSVTYGITGNLEQSEDLAQEAFVAAWQSLEDLRDLRKFPSWVCGIARNLARGALRRRQRDPLDRSCTLPDDHPGELEAVPDRVERKDRERVMWEALEAIPDAYREPLVIFYREGRSIRSVAEALDITEPCARQRLSRGRQMLKARVAQVVEEALEQTRPGAAFTVAVVAGLPALSAQAAAAGTAASAVGEGAALGGKGSVAGAAAAGAGALGGLLGTVVGMTGGLFGMWVGIRSSPTLRTRRYGLKLCGVTYALVWVFLGTQGALGALFWHNPALLRVLFGVAWVLYIPALVGLIVLGNRAYQRLIDEDAGKRPAPTLRLEESPWSRRRVWRCFYWTTSVAVLGSVGSVVWIYCIPAARPYWPVAAVVFLMCHLAYVALFRKGFRTAHDEASFKASRTEHAHLTGVTCPHCESSEVESMWGPAKTLAAMLLGLEVLSIPLLWPVASSRGFLGAFCVLYGLGFLVALLLVGLLLHFGKRWKRCRQCHHDFGCEYRSKIEIRGLPLICVGAWTDPSTGQKRQCKGIIAIGGRPVGIVAIGGVPVGVISIGGVAFGGVALGGVSIGLIGGGGVAVALLLACGGVAVGGIAVGGAALGYCVFGGDGWGVHVIGGGFRDAL